MKLRPFEHLNLLATKEHKAQISRDELLVRFLEVGKSMYKNFTISKETVKSIFTRYPQSRQHNFNDTYKDVTAHVLGVKSEEIIWHDRQEGKSYNREGFEKLS